MPPLQPSGNLRPDGPYPCDAAATVLILRSTVGGPKEVLQARLDILVDSGIAHASIVKRDNLRIHVEPVRVGADDDVVTIVRKVLNALL